MLPGYTVTFIKICGNIGLLSLAFSALVANPKKNDFNCLYGGQSRCSWSAEQERGMLRRSRCALIFL